MLVALRFTVVEGDEATFRRRAETAMTALSARPGFRRGGLSRAIDDVGAWLLLTEWDSVGSWRRALSSYDVKMSAVPLLSQAVDEPSAYETLVVDDGGGAGLHVIASDRAADADTTGPLR
ncbi:MAG: hypothetical protein QOG53_3592 [Frankiales bacterium]|jgi:hypothetical protein|nr:hypothetical protein [Frankiales bacterium]